MIWMFDTLLRYQRQYIYKQICKRFYWNERDILNGLKENLLHLLYISFFEKPEEFSTKTFLMLSGNEVEPLLFMGFIIFRRKLNVFDKLTFKWIGNMFTHRFCCSLCHFKYNFIYLKYYYSSSSVFT